ncbi:precorrin-2 C(20)-methyltransferase [Calderihabitans maritimus]|uniref:Cobalt-factor II C20-methyltransferase/precorrin-2 C20-methyltransferase n=1 Tax=Calderihabitans maritimus TaxID=1246530 RepID=A0A1Z5HPR6_9FIRM|nr:precorrin-2 C(20)-methyltransferase [Calderihabitans maritimus]GAW91526.1 cobalt-factor II C20-methyltransferase/precorrin-2 C20-methyltransferase [Calderihabitans maritimus]
MKGKFFGIGVGPGDPELITLKGYRLLRHVDVVMVPKARKDQSSVALKVIEQYLRSEQEVVELVLPMTRDRETLETYWQEAAKDILNFLQQGKNVAFVTLGDPATYSTYSYVMKKLQEIDPSIEIETVPGITSYSAAASRLNLPLAEGEEKIAIVPLLHHPEELELLTAHFENLVLLKVSSHYRELVDYLERKHLLDKAVLVSRCGHPGEQIERNLRKALDRKPDYLSLILIKQEGPV